MKAVRVALVVIGVAGTAEGAWLLVTTVRPSGLVGLAIWLAAAVVLHDAILSPVLFVLGWLLRLGGRRLPLAVLAIVQVAVVVGAIGSLLLLPAIHAKRLGVRNPSVLPLDYAANLAGLWIVLGALTVVAVAAVLVRSRQHTRSSVRDG